MSVQERSLDVCLKRDQSLRPLQATSRQSLAGLGIEQRLCMH
jgi:hypothetical protein